MNYREFTERVYNYKHGLTNSAESQNIEHSAKQSEEINEEKKEESTEESIQHSAPGDEWEQHEYIKKIPIGNGKFRYVYEEGQNAGKSIVNYGAPKTSAPKSNLPLAPAPTVQQQAQTPAPKAPAVTNPPKSNAQSASDPSFVDGRNAAYGNEQKKEATTEEKQTGISNNEVALELLTKYANGLKGVYDTLKSKGYDENEVDEIINTIEGAFGYSNIYNQIKNYNGEQIQFFDDAEEGLKNMIEEVLPEAKNYAETISTKPEQQAREDMRKFMEPLNIKEVEYLNAAQKAAQNGELPAKEVLNPYDSYLRNLGYDPADITGADLKKAFPSMYNPNFSDEEHYALQNDQTFAPISNTNNKMNQFVQMTPNERWIWAQEHPEDKALLESIGPLVNPTENYYPITEEGTNNSGINPNKWYNSLTGEFATGTTEADDNEFFAAYRKSFYNTLVNQMKKDPKFTSIYSEKEIEDLARSWTNSNVENMKIAANNK